MLYINSLTNVETQAFYTKKYLEKIYFEDELLEEITL